MFPSNDTPAKQLAAFIQKFTPEIASLARAILAKMRTRYPTALELVYDNYNALPEKKLQGTGSVAKHIRLESAGALDDPVIRTLMQAAVEKVKVPLDPATNIASSSNRSQPDSVPAVEGASVDSNAKSGAMQTAPVNSFFAL